LLFGLQPPRGAAARKILLLRGRPNRSDLENPMHTMMPGRAAEIQACRVRLTREPTAAAEARGQVRAAIGAWGVPVAEDVAVLLTSELVTNTVNQATGETVTLGIRCARNQLRVDVHDMSPSPPVPTNASAASEAGRGLVLVARLSTEWGFHHTPYRQSRLFHARVPAGSQQDPRNAA